MTATPQQQAAVLAVLRAMAETVREAGPQGAPKGPMYAALMARIPGLTAEGFNALCLKLQNAGLVRQTADVLTWTGPEITPT